MNSLTSECERAFEHLDRLSDDRGIFRNGTASGFIDEQGYCTDDNARLLLVTSCEPDTGIAHRLNHLALNFVLDSLDKDGRCRNRMDKSGNWADRARTNETWGRCVGALGVTASHHTDPSVRQMAMEGFTSALRQRSGEARAMAFAALGVAEVVTTNPDRTEASVFLADFVKLVGEIPVGKVDDPTWIWPETRLTQANAVLPDALIAAGGALNDDSARERGLMMLSWLLQRQISSGHLSVTGIGGQGPKDLIQRSDQLPSEVATLADACSRAFKLTKSPAWSAGILAAENWFRGKNDSCLAMFDSKSGGGFDALKERSVGPNQGAESTLALVRVWQCAESTFAAI